MKTIKLEFKGYRREKKKSGLEDRAGIYCVYAGTYNEETDKVDVQELLYIGKAHSIKRRIGGNDHEHLDDWKRALKQGQILIYTRAFVSNDEDRTRAEGALIYYYQPPINDIGKDDFHHRDTKIIVNGKHKFIDDEFTVFCTN